MFWFIYAVIIFNVTYFNCISNYKNGIFILDQRRATVHQRMMCIQNCGKSVPQCVPYVTILVRLLIVLHHNNMHIISFHERYCEVSVKLCNFKHTALHKITLHVSAYLIIIVVMKRAAYVGYVGLLLLMWSNMARLWDHISIPPFNLNLSVLQRAS